MNDDDIAVHRHALVAWLETWALIAACDPEAVYGLSEAVWAQTGESLRVTLVGGWLFNSAALDFTGEHPTVDAVATLLEVCEAGPDDRRWPDLAAAVATLFVPVTVGTAGPCTSLDTPTVAFRLNGLAIGVAYQPDGALYVAEPDLLPAVNAG